MQRPHQLSLIALSTVIALLLWIVWNQGWSTQWQDFGTLDWLAYWSIPRGVLLGQGFFNMEWQVPAQRSLGYFTVAGSSFTYEALHLWNLPPTLLPLLPFGALPFPVAVVVWYILSFFLYLLAGLSYGLPTSAPLIIRKWIATVWIALPLISLVPGQVLVFLTACLIFAWLAACHGHSLAVAALAFPLMMKPHLFAPALLLIFVSDWEGVGKARLYFLAILILSSITAYFLDPTWISGWLTQGTPSNLQTYGLSDLIARILNLPARSELLSPIIGVTLAFWRFWKKPIDNRHMLSEAIWIGFLSSPHIWRHDSVMLLPAILETSLAANRRQFLLLALIPLVWWIPLPDAMSAMLSSWELSPAQVRAYMKLIIFYTYVGLSGLSWWWLTTWTKTEKQRLQRKINDSVSTL